MYSKVNEAYDGNFALQASRQLANYSERMIISIILYTIDIDIGATLLRLQMQTIPIVVTKMGAPTINVNNILATFAKTVPAGAL